MHYGHQSHYSQSYPLYQIKQYILMLPPIRLIQILWTLQSLQQLCNIVLSKKVNPGIELGNKLYNCQFSLVTGRMQSFKLIQNLRELEKKGMNRKNCKIVLKILVQELENICTTQFFCTQLKKIGINRILKIWLYQKKNMT